MIGMGATKTSPLRERLEWVVKHRGFRSMRELSTKAGLSPTALSTTITRVEQGFAHSFSASTLLNLAQVARVNPEWLATGTGRPDPDTEMVEGRYAFARQVIDSLVSDGVCDAKEARRVVGDIAFQEGNGFPSAAAMYRVAVLTILADRGILTGAKQGRLRPLSHEKSLGNLLCLVLQARAADTRRAQRPFSDFMGHRAPCPGTANTRPQQNHAAAQDSVSG